MLDDRARAMLTQALARPPRDYAIDAYRWTIGAVGLLIRRALGFSFSRVYVRQLIIDLGFADGHAHHAATHGARQAAQA